MSFTLCEGGTETLTALASQCLGLRAWTRLRVMLVYEFFKIVTTEPKKKKVLRREDQKYH